MLSQECVIFYQLSIIQLHYILLFYKSIGTFISLFILRHCYNIIEHCDYYKCQKFVKFIKTFFISIKSLNVSVIQNYNS